MYDTFLDIFQTICIKFIDFIPAFLGLWLIFNFISNLLFQKDK